MSSPIKLERLCMAVCGLARETGQFVKAEGLKLGRSNIHLKGAKDYVTDVDRASEQRLVSELGRLLPEAGFIAEEGTSDKRGDRYNWVIDPIDGTTNFIHSIPCFAISIGLQENDRIILGVVYEINLDECFYAWGESSAYLNGEVIRVSDTTDPGDSLVATGFPYKAMGKQDQYLLVFKEMLNLSRGLRRLGSAATDLAYVAAGRFDGFYEYNLHAWDVAAGSFIVERAGGKVSDFSNGRGFLSGKEMLATNGALHNDFLQAINKHFS